MTPLDLAKAFLEKGRDDENLLEVILEDVRIPDWLFGFHAQQAAEKYLKALLAVAQEKPARTHDLDFLIAQCRRAAFEVPAELE